MAHAFFRHRSQALLDGAVEGPATRTSKPRPMKVRPSGSAAISASLTQIPQRMHLPGSKMTPPGLELLFEGPALRAEAAGVGAIDLGVMLEHAVARRAAVAMQASRRLPHRLAAVDPGRSGARRHAVFLAGGAQEIPQFARLQPAHDAGKRLSPAGAAAGRAKDGGRIRRPPGPRPWRGQVA